MRALLVSVVDVELLAGLTLCIVKFGLCGNKLREAAMRGDVPGLTKASW